MREHFHDPDPKAGIGGRRAEQNYSTALTAYPGLGKRFFYLRHSGARTPFINSTGTAGLAKIGIDRERKHRMRPPEKFVRIVNRTRYDVSKATLLAGDDYWDGHNFERHGRNTFLYRTPNSAYFTVTLTQWQGEQDTLTPVTLEEAIAFYEGAENIEGHDLSEHRATYAEAFPGVEVKDA